MDTYTIIPRHTSIHAQGKGGKDKWDGARSIYVHNASDTPECKHAYNCNQYETGWEVDVLNGACLNCSGGSRKAAL